MYVRENTAEKHHCDVHLEDLVSEAFCAVAFKALCYRQEGRGFEARWSDWMFSIYLVLSTALDPGVYSESNRNDYQKQKHNVSRE
jgi:hypothetical protein